MGQENKIETGTDSRFGAYCDVHDCDWEVYAESETIAHTVLVCHMVVKHPEMYALTTGNNPYEARRRYAEIIRAVRKFI